jgi:hypothetical protein
MKKDAQRIIAAEQGLPTYTPLKPCARGHFERETAGGRCIPCRRLRERLLVAKNRDAHNKRKRLERLHKLPEIAEKARIARSSETAEARALRLEKARVNQVKWRLQNEGRESVRDAKRRYKKSENGRAVTREATIRRRAAKIHRTPAWLTDDDVWMMREAYLLAAMRTHMFGFAWHVDHVLPLQGREVSGLHVPCNLQVIPWIDNVRKANKLA